MQHFAKPGHLKKKKKGYTLGKKFKGRPAFGGNFFFVCFLHERRGNKHTREIFDNQRILKV